MDVFYWVQIVGAVFLGNILFAMLAFFLHRVSTQERSGKKAEDLPFWVFVIGLTPLIAFAGIVASLS